MNGHNLTIVSRITSSLVDEDTQTIHLAGDTVLDEQPSENVKIRINGYRLHIKGLVDIELLNKQLAAEGV